MISNYSTCVLNDREVSIDVGSECYGVGTGQSHERIIQSAGGEIGFDGFYDPRPGFNGKIYADRMFINNKENVIQGINFSTERGEFCCSYEGIDYEDIKDSNKQDCAQKLSKSIYNENELKSNYDNGIRR